MSKKIAIITGATGGVGREYTRQLIDDVEEVWAIARNQERLSALEQEYNHKVVGISLDLSDEANLQKIKERLQSEDVVVRYLVNNAGSGRFGESSGFSPEELTGHVMTHNIAMAILCNFCIPYMEPGSHIINMVSQASFQPLPYANLYAACKAFNLSYSRALRVELKTKGILVTTVCPGWIKTNLLPEKLNGVSVKFPHIKEAEDIVRKAVKDAKKGKNVSVYGPYVKGQRFLVKLLPSGLVMKVWMKGIKKYIED